MKNNAATQHKNLENVAFYSVLMYDHMLHCYCTYFKQPLWQFEPPHAFSCSVISTVVTADLPLLTHAGWLS